ncbi:MAG TPA: Hsp70 family protein, partial [Stellaceae bacterium]|nr:Hsp70 family protein [Stellaceae bacterium]
MRERVSIGVDFGTTNTVVAIARPGEGVRPVMFRDERETSDIYRSVLLFEKGLSAAGLDLEAHAGLQAVRLYLTAAAETRFIQSFKSHVASPAFEETRIFGRRFRFEDLLATFFRRAVADAEGGIEPAGAQIVSGRPVAFVGAAPDEALAIARYGEAYRRIGVSAPAYVYEPVGAAYYYAQRLTSDALVLVADFGGGTSDFS